MSDDGYHQPYVDEWAGGYRRQLPGQASLDIGVIHRDFRDRTALIEQNAIYDGNQIRRLPQSRIRGEIFLVTNNRWNWPVYTALEFVATKTKPPVPARLQATHVSGPTSPARGSRAILRRSFSRAPLRSIEVSSSNDNRYASLSDSYMPARQYDALVQLRSGLGMWRTLAAAYHAAWEFHAGMRATRFSTAGGQVRSSKTVRLGSAVRTGQHHR